jgi:hypothetical protein
VLAHRSTAFFTRSLKRAFSAALISIWIVGCSGLVQKPVSSVTPSLSLSATKFNFQNVLVGQTVTQTLVISDSGTTPLHITAVSVSNKEFSISGPSLPRTIVGGNSVTYTLAFSPTVTGSASAALKISSNASSGPDSVSLAGSGESAFANLVVTPASINFGNLALTKTSTQNVILQNTGDINLTLQGVTVAGSGFGYSDLSPGFSLSPNQKITFQVWFTPKVVGPASAQVSLLSPNLPSPATLSLSGDGVSSSSSAPSPTPTPTQHSALLTWVASTSQVIGYRIYRSETSGGDYVPLVGAAISALTYDDTTVALGTTYYYVVTAVDAAGNESVYSNQATAVIPSS